MPPIVNAAAELDDLAIIEEDAQFLINKINNGLKAIPGSYETEEPAASETVPLSLENGGYTKIDTISSFRLSSSSTISDEFTDADEGNWNLLSSISHLVCALGDSSSSENSFQSIDNSH